MVAQGYKQTEVGVIPDDWEVKEFGEMVDYKKGFPFRSKDYKGDGIRIIRISDTTYTSINDNNGIYIDETRKEEFKQWALKEFDLIFSSVGSKPPMYNSMVGKVIMIEKKFENSFLNQNAVLIRDKGNRVHIQILLLHNFRTKRYIRHIEEIYRGNANQASITLDELFKFQISFPPTLSEQTAIATALSDTDSLISSIETLIAKKRNIKQGAMTTLLSPKEGWDVKKLGEVCEIKKGQLITESTRVNGNIPVIAGGKNPAYYHNKPNRKGKTITISGSGASAGYVSFHNYPIFASDCSTINESQFYSIEFIYYFLSIKQEEIYNKQTGGAQPHIHPSDLNPLLIFIPSKEEQIEIAIILSDMDNEIAALETKLEKYKLIKQGMMSELLTGKIRLV